MELFTTLRADLRRTYEKVHGSRLSRIVQTARTPGVQAVVVYRFGRWLKGLPLPVRLPLEPAYYVLNGLVQFLWGIELPREAKIGPGLRISHFGGVIVSPFAVIGRNCGIGNGVTIGLAGEGEKCGAPVIGDDVYIATGAKIFGKIRVGNNVKIGANAVIHRDVVDNAVCVLDPGFRILSFKGNRRSRVALAS
jgi:serine O-acetyltransferase